MLWRGVALLYRRGWGIPGLVMLGVLLLARPSSGEDRVQVRGNYYREASTRVLQPTVDLEVDLPQTGISIGTAYVLDAVSSASIASGTAQVTGGDFVFTEIRHEVSGRIASRWDDWGLGAFFRYSTETDYVSRSLGVSISRELLQRSITVGFAYAYNFDRVSRIQANTRVRAPWCGGMVDVALCQDSGHGRGSNLRQVHYVAGSYAHALHRTVLGLASVEVARTLGPQDNPYRGSQIPSSEYEIHPLQRTQLALWSAVRWMLPVANIVIEPRYRFSIDSWRVNSHTLDARVHVRVLDHLRVRARYRYYRQSESFICRDNGGEILDDGTSFSCTTADSAFATADPKMGAFDSHTPGIQLVVELDGLSQHRHLGWLERGWIEATYNHVFQSNRFGPARLGALAFSLAF